MQETIELLAYYRQCQGSSRGLYTSSSQIILIIYLIPTCQDFRPGYGCNTAFLKVIEDWKKAVDNNLYVAAVLMNLSTAFDCLPHDLLLLNLKAYYLYENALNLINDYLSNIKQCVKVGTYFSTWQHIYKGVPQGSILNLCFLMYFLMTFSIL